mgnify:CR=1 FL=1
MLLEDDPECRAEDGRIVCETDQQNQTSIGTGVSESQAIQVEQAYQKRQQLSNQDQGRLRNWLNEKNIDDCYTKHKRSNGKIESEFICIERHRREKLARGAKEIGKTFAPSP